MLPFVLAGKAERGEKRIKSQLLRQFSALVGLLEEGLLPPPAHGSQL